MRSRIDRFFDTWDELGLWNQYGLAVVGTLGMFYMAISLAAWL